MEWQQFVMNLGTLNPASVEEILVRHGAQSVTFSDAGDVPVLEPGPGETPLWSKTRITGLFDPGVDMNEVLEDLQTRSPGCGYRKARPWTRLRNRHARDDGHVPRMAGHHGPARTNRA